MAGPAKFSARSKMPKHKSLISPKNPKGALYVAAPLGLGRRLIAPQVPAFLAAYPEVSIRLRLTDRKVDLTTEGLDLAFFLGQPADSTLRIRKIADVPRILCAAPSYIAARGNPTSGDELVADRHECLNLRFPGATEFQWRLRTEEGLKKYRVTGRYESDDGDVLTDWALAGHGITLKPVFEISDHPQGRAAGASGGENPARTQPRWPAFSHTEKDRTQKHVCSWIS